MASSCNINHTFSYILLQWVLTMISFWRADGTIHFGKRYDSFKIHYLVIVQVSIFSENKVCYPEVSRKHWWRTFRLSNTIRISEVFQMSNKTNIWSLHFYFTTYPFPYSVPELHSIWIHIHLRFVLDDVKNNGIENQNNHWQPLHKMCPFCLLDFRYVVM